MAQPGTAWRHEWLHFLRRLPARALQSLGPGGSMINLRRVGMGGSVTLLLGTLGCSSSLGGAELAPSAEPGGKGSSAAAGSSSTNIGPSPSLLGPSAAGGASSGVAPDREGEEI